MNGIKKVIAVLTGNVALGILPLAAFGVRGIWWALQGKAETMLWFCYAASVLVGIGMLSRTPVLNGIGLLWLVPGNILWVIRIVTMNDFSLGSASIHVIGLVVGLVGMHRMSLPKKTWLYAFVAALILGVITRLLGTAPENVNFVFRLQYGFVALFRSHALFLAVFAASLAPIFLLTQSVLLLLTPHICPDQEQKPS